jgi:hypothetical protein
MITRVYIIIEYYLYTRVVSSGRGVLSYEKRGATGAHGVLVRVRRTFRKRELSSVISGGYWKR